MRNAKRIDIDAKLFQREANSYIDATLFRCEAHEEREANNYMDAKFIAERVRNAKRIVR